MNQTSIYLTAEQNFFKHEITDSESAKKYNIENTITVDEAIRATQLAIYILQPTRNKFGAIKINSWKRCEELNDKIGGSKNSQHLLAEAADIIPLKESIVIVYNWMKKNLMYDQLILEYSNTTHKPTWIHVSYTTRYKNRMMSFEIKR